MAACLPPLGFGSFVWIALTPLTCAVWLGSNFVRTPAGRHWRCAQLGYVAGVVFFTLTFHWLGTLGPLFKTPLLAGIPLLLALYMGLYFAFWAWFIGVVLVGPGEQFGSSIRNLGIAAAGACAWTAQEWVRGWLFYGFGWNGLNVAAYRDLTMIQAADVVGAFGITWLIAFCNLMAVIIVRRIVNEFGPSFTRHIRWEFSVTMLLIGCVFAYGVRALLKPAPPSTTLRVAAVQTNVAQADRWEEGDVPAMEALAKLMPGAAALKPDLIVWPEAATPSDIYNDLPYIAQYAELGDFSILTGTLFQDFEKSKSYNGAALVTDGALEVQVYRKIHLVPFGEFLPLRKEFPPMEWIAGALVPGDFDRGDEYTVFTLPHSEQRVAPLVCFEDTVGDLTRRFVAAGAQLLINVTNDGWFLKSAGAETHLANALLRTVENRRPLLRCGNTGITGVIDSNGRELGSLPPFRPGIFMHGVQVPKAASAPTTFYTRHGNWVAYGSSYITLGILVFALGRGLRRKSRPPR